MDEFTHAQSNISADHQVKRRSQKWLNFFAGTDPDISKREQQNADRVRAAAAEGMVLLENNGVLPLSENVKAIALFGSGARHTVKGGTGSGDVNSRNVVNIEAGLEDAGFTVTTKNVFVSLNG